MTEPGRSSSSTSPGPVRSKGGEPRVPHCDRIAQGCQQWFFQAGQSTPGFRWLGSWAVDRIAIMGCGGSGKSHLARSLGNVLGITPVHLDGL